MSNTIGANIRRIREHKPWTQEQLAGAACVDVRTVQRAEKGQPISAESLQAVTGALDVSIELLRVDQEELHKQVQELQKKYKLLNLVRVNRAFDLRDAMHAGAMQLDYVQLLTDKQQLAVAQFEQAIKDWKMIWDDLEPVQRHDAFLDIQRNIDELRESGLVLAAGCETLKLNSGSIPEPFDMEILYLMISTEGEPKLTVARERNRRVSFV